MKACNEECYSVSSDIDSDLSDLGKGDLLLPRVYSVVKIEVKVSMINVMVVHRLLHLLICSGFHEENFYSMFLQSRKFEYARIA
jgi:hypothetical protein